MGCLAHAAQLERKREKIEAAGARVIAVGPGTEISADRVTRLFGLHYPVFGDRRASVFGVFGFKRVLAVVQQSGVAVIDRDGAVRYIHRTANFADALRLDDVMRTLTEIGTEGA